MTDDAALRAGDSDRDRVAAVLASAFAEGRLTRDEYDTRLAAAHAAVTFGDLAPLTADLPGGSATPVPAGAPVAAAPVAPAPSPASPARGTGADRRKGLAAAWGAWAGVSLLMVVIWLGTVITRGDAAMPSFWPIWVIGPWGAAMVIASLTSRDDR